MKRVDEYGPTPMERAEGQCMSVQALLDSPMPFSIRAFGRSMIGLCRAMLAAMREHQEMMVNKK